MTDWDKDHVDLKWSPPREDGGAPITGYIVEKKDKFGNWEKAVEVPADKTTATVPDLIEGQTYEFRWVISWVDYVVGLRNYTTNSFACRRRKKWLSDPRL